MACDLNLNLDAVCVSVLLVAPPVPSIHCTPLPLHPPLPSIQVPSSRGASAKHRLQLPPRHLGVRDDHGRALRVYIILLLQYCNICDICSTTMFIFVITIIMMITIVTIIATITIVPITLQAELYTLYHIYIYIYRERERYYQS